jgi:hypothetical protein
MLRAVLYLNYRMQRHLVLYPGNLHAKHGHKQTIQTPGSHLTWVHIIHMHYLQFEIPLHKYAKWGPREDSVQPAVT